MKLKKVLALLFVLASVFQVNQLFGRNTNPHHYLWIALQNGVRLDVEGERLYQKASRLGLIKPLFHCFVEERGAHSVCANDFYISPHRLGVKNDEYLYIHSKFMSESFDEKTRVLKEALEAYIDENSIR